MESLNRNEVQIDVSDLPAGMYLLHVSDPGRK